MKLFLSIAVALLTINRGTTSSCPADTDNGTDVTLTLNCTMNNPTVSYKKLSPFNGYFWVTIEYTCTNSSSSIVDSGILANQRPATSASQSITPTLASGVQCTFSGCYVSAPLTTLAIQPTPCIVDINECSRGLHNCNENAVCNNTLTSFICECKFGYEGDGLNCTNIDECLTGANNCSDNATCTDTNGGYNCTCKRGFEGDGLSCFDIDECLTANCSVTATCTDLVDGYNCTCNRGFEGDGVSCTNVDECLRGIHDCHTAANCVDSVGGFLCLCKPGYEGNGTFCGNVNECDQEASCDTNAECTDVEGSYECHCNHGYTGDGLTCTNFDECESDDSNNCHENAQCTDTVGSYTCSCNPGYTGDGINCTNINECESDDSNNCHENAQCTNTVGSFTCSCNPGYTGDGVNCTNINECELEIHTCSSNAICTDKDGSFNCTCREGFEGDGFNCTDVPECEGDCHSNATCRTNTIGSYVCICNTGFTGDGFTCADTQTFKVAVAVALVLLAVVLAIAVATALVCRQAQSCEEDNKPFPLAVILTDKIDPDFNPVSLHTLTPKPGSVVSIINALSDSRSATFETSSGETDQLEEFPETVVCSKYGSNTHPKGNNLLGSETLCSRNENNVQIPSAADVLDVQSPQTRHTSGIQQEAIRPSLDPEQQLSSLQMKQPALPPLLTSCTLGETNHTCLGSVLLSPTFPSDDSGFYQDSEGYIKNSSEVNSGTVTPKKEDRKWTDTELMTKLALPLSVCYNAQTIQRMQFPTDEEEGYMETRILQEESS